MTHDNARSMYLQILIFEARILVGNKCNLITVVLMVMLYASDFLAHPVLHMKLEAYFFFFFSEVCFMSLLTRGGEKGVTAFQTLFKDTNGNKGYPQVTGMVPKAWL